MACRFMFAYRWRRPAADDISGQYCGLKLMEARLKTGLWVKTVIRRCDLATVAVAVVARGDSDSGAVLLKLNAREEGCSVLTQARDPNGELIWMRATGPTAVAEADADSYIARQRRRDPDLWVIEIETGSPGAVLDGRIV
jgi:hypothetical protein